MPNLTVSYKEEPKIMGSCDKCGDELRGDYTYFTDVYGNVFCSQDCAVAYNEIEERDWD